jgi:hypothetical protein
MQIHFSLVTLVKKNLTHFSFTETFLDEIFIETASKVNLAENALVSETWEKDTPNFGIHDSSDRNFRSTEPCLWPEREEGLDDREVLLLFKRSVKHIVKVVFIDDLLDIFLELRGL